jgi:formylglycine-generating enzyme required for sulfatase activity
MKLVWCPPGIFTMTGYEDVEEATSNDNEAENDSNDADNREKPAPKPHTTVRTPVKVFLKDGYWLGKYEVTQTEWNQVMSTKPWKGRIHRMEGDDFPVTYVSWDDAMQFCRKLTKREREAGQLPDGWEYTLPTEAQWERACRARTETNFSFGDDTSKLGEYAWFHDNASSAGESYAHRVGQKKPNPWGLCDMHGNVWEWCRDYYTEKVPGGRDPEVTKKALNHVLRGGYWSHDAIGCMSASRYWYSPGSRPESGTYGFRPALSSVQPVK